MRCVVLKRFKHRGELQLPGSIRDVPEDMLHKMSGFVQAIATADSYPPADWRPEPKAWLTSTGEFRSQGVFAGEWPNGGLAPEIVKLTADNLVLQKKLLRDHVGVYSPPMWIHTIRRWQARAAFLFENNGKGLHEANWQAAGGMHLKAFAEELLIIVDI